MITKTDSKKLTKLIESFYNLTHIKVAVYDADFNEILAYPKRDAQLCEMVKKNKSSCLECDKSTHRICAKCALKQTVLVEKCHAGLTEVLAPLSDGVSIIGYIMFGQITNEKDRDIFEKNILERCEKYNLPQDDVLDALSKIQYFSDEKIEDVSKILNALAVYIAYEKIVYSDEMSMAYEVTEYIRKNLGEDLSVAAICKKFYLSKSEIYKITKTYMPEGVAAFVKCERIKKAAEELAYTDKPVWKIAEEVGFSDVDYFLRVFKHEKGMPAAKYRKNSRIDKL